MKRKILSLMLVLAMLTALAVMPAAAEGISVRINGSEVSFDQPPISINDRTMVPMRAIFEALGASVDWDDATQTAISDMGGTTVIMTIGSNVMYVNSMPVALDTPAQMVNDRTLVPVRAIAEAFDCNVEWDDSTQTVDISWQDDSIGKVLTGTNYYFGNACISNGVVYYTNAMQHYIFAYNLSTGETTQYATNSAPLQIIANGNSIYYCKGDGKVCSIDIKSKEETILCTQFSSVVLLNDSTRNGPNLAMYNGILYAYSDKTLYAIDPKTGEYIGDYTIPVSCGPGDVAFWNDNIYFVGHEDEGISVIVLNTLTDETKEIYYEEGQCRDGGKVSYINYAWDYDCFAWEDYLYLYVKMDTHGEFTNKYYKISSNGASVTEPSELEFLQAAAIYKDTEYLYYDGGSMESGGVNKVNPNDGEADSLYRSSKVCRYLYSDSDYVVVWEGKTSKWWTYASNYTTANIYVMDKKGNNVKQIASLSSNADTSSSSSSSSSNSSTTNSMGYERCTVCDGTGKITCPICDGTKHAVAHNGDCYYCAGTGKIDCAGCNGVGYRVSP